EERSHETGAVAPPDDARREDSDPAEAEIPREPHAFGDGLEERRLDRHTGERDAPDERENAPAHQAAEEDAVRGREGARDEDEDRRVVEAAKDLAGERSLVREVVETACGEDEESRAREDADDDHAQPGAASAPDQRHRQSEEDDRTHQVGE